MGMRIAVSRSVLIGIQRESAIVAPLEACGLLFGSDAAVTGWQAADNVAQDPARHFEIDPRALFAALRAERAGGARVVGYWHSHPTGDPSPSTTDAAMAAPDGKLWLIVGGEVKAWRAVERGEVHGRFDPIETVEAD
jgi:desampylase